LTREADCGVIETSARSWPGRKPVKKSSRNDNHRKFNARSGENGRSSWLLPDYCAASNVGASVECLEVYMTYAEKLKDQRWQKKRLELLEASGWKCQSFFCFSKAPNPTLHVHHRIYIRGLAPWDYEDWAYQVLCEECHSYEQQEMANAYEGLAKYETLLRACSLISKLPPEDANRISSIIVRLCDVEHFTRPTADLVTSVLQFRFDVSNITEELISK
jgi:hypothetical protein